MVRAAQSLYLLSDSLKLSLLLSQSQMSDARDTEAEQLVQATEAYKRECSELLARHWLPGAVAGPAPSDTPHDEPMETTSDAERLADDAK